MKRLCVVIIGVLLMAGCSSAQPVIVTPSPTATVQPPLTEEQLDKAIKTEEDMSLIGLFDKDDVTIKNGIDELSHVFTADLQMQLQGKLVAFLIYDFDLEYKGNQLYLTAYSPDYSTYYEFLFGENAKKTFEGKSKNPNAVYLMSVQVSTVEAIKLSVNASGNSDEGYEIDVSNCYGMHVVKGTCYWLKDIYFFGLDK